MGRVQAVHLLFVTALLGGCASVAVAPSPSGPVAGTTLPEGREVPAPSGFIDFCQRNPGQCTGTTASAIVPISAATWTLLAEVNQVWNAAVKPMEDAAHYGRVDYWTIPEDGYGDCEDYALGKRKSLIERGIPASALTLALVQKADGPPHAVLTVRTNMGDYVLDNQNRDVLPWKAANYVWLARQTAGERWVSIGADGAGRTRLATAAIVP